jgi:hypothetical protein
MKKIITPQIEKKTAEKKSIFKKMPFFNTIILTLLSILIIFIFLNTGSNAVWYNNKIVTYWNEYSDQADNLSIEYRNIHSLDNEYSMSEELVKRIPENYKDHILILMPSRKYFQDRGISYHVPLPVVFYYYTGVKTIWANSKDAIKANSCFRIEGNSYVLEKITDTTRLKTLIAQFNADNYEL